MKEEIPDSKYLKVVPNISKMLIDDDPDNDFPVSKEMTQEKRYNEASELGRGAMKQVNLAQDTLTDRRVALAKLIDKDNPDKTEQFFLEARLTARLQHPNIVPVYDAGFDDRNEAFFTMKPVGDRTLRNYIKSFNQGQNSDLQERLEMFSKICYAIAYAHANNVIHRDLKPENIYLGEFGEVLVGDWGLAKVLEVDYEDIDLHSDDSKTIHTMHGVLKGTPGYMAPEQIDQSLGVSDEQSDIYSLGVILFELLLLTHPNKGSDMEKTLTNTLQGNRPDKLEVNLAESLTAIINKAMAIKKGDRYLSVVEITVDLKKFQGGFVTSAENNSFAKSFLFLLKRHKQVSTVLGILIISSIIFTLRIYQEKRIAENQKSEALAQKQIAENQKSEALAQKQIADKARNNVEEISKKASPRFVSVARSDFENFRFESAMNNINLAVSLDPNNQEAKQFKARFLYSSQRFQEAGKLFDELPTRKFQRAKIRKVLNKFLAVKINDDHFLNKEQMITFLKDNETNFTRGTPPKRLIFQLVNYAYTLDVYSMEEKIAFAECALKTSNNRLPQNWTMKAKIIDNKVLIDLSHQEIISIDALRLFPLLELDLSFTTVKDIKCMKESSIEVLKISGNRIIASDIRKIQNLKKLYTNSNYLDGKLKDHIQIIKNVK